MARIVQFRRTRRRVGTATITVSDQTADFGAKTNAAGTDGGWMPLDSNNDLVTLSSVNDQTGATRTWSISGGRLVANGTVDVDDGQVLNLTTTTGVTFDATINSIANAAHVAPSTSTTGRANLITTLAALDSATDWTIYMRPGEYGTVGGVFAITTTMSGSVTHSNTSMATHIADPSGYTYDDTASFSGGSILFKATEGEVIWKDRTQLNAGADCIGWSGTITMDSGLASTASVAITSTAASGLGDFLFQGISITHEAAGNDVVAAGIYIQGANRVVIEDCEMNGQDNPVNHLACIHLDLRRNWVWAYENDALSTRNETIDRLGDVTCYVTLDNNVIADRGTGVSHGDNYQASSSENQLPYQFFVSGNVFGPYAQGFFIGDTGNTMAIEVDNVSGGTPAVNDDFTYGPSEVYSFRIRAIEDLGGGDYRWTVTRGYAPGTVKGDFTIPFPEDNDTLTNGSITASMNGTVTEPLLYGGVIFDNYMYHEHGQAMAITNLKMLAVNNTVVRFADDTTDTTSPDNFMAVNGDLLDTFAVRNVGMILTSTDLSFDNVDLDATLTSGSTSYDSVFDNSDKTFSLNGDGQIVPSTQRTRNDPGTLRAYMEDTFATSQDAGANKTMVWTKPTLSNATITSCDTNTGNGRMFWCVGDSGLTLDAYEVANGVVGWVNGLGTAASDSGYEDVSATGTITPSTAPTVAGGESVYWCHVAETGGISAITEVVGEVNIVTNGDFESATGWTMATGYSISGGVLTYDGTGAAFGGGTTRADCANDAADYTASIMFNSLTTTAGSVYVYYYDGVTNHLMGSVTLSGKSTGVWYTVGTKTFAADTNGQISIKVSAATDVFSLSDVKIVAA